MTIQLLSHKPQCSGQSLGQGRDVGNEKQYQDEHHEIRKQHLGDLLYLELGYSAADEQNRTYGRGHCSYTQVVNQHGSELNGGHAEGMYYGPKYGHEDQNGRSHVHKHSDHQEQHVDKQQNYYYIVTYGQYGLADGPRNSRTHHHIGHGRRGGDEEKNYRTDHGTFHEDPDKGFDRNTAIEQREYEAV